MGEMLSPLVIKTILLSAGLFILVWQFLSRALFKPFLQIAIEREEQTVGAEKRATKLRTQAAEIDREVENALQLSRIEALRICDGIVAEAKAQGSSLIQSSMERARARLESAAGTERDVRADIKRELTAELAGLSYLIVSRLSAGNRNQTVH